MKLRAHTHKTQSTSFRGIELLQKRSSGFHTLFLNDLRIIWISKIRKRDQYHFFFINKTVIRVGKMNN